MKKNFALVFIFLLFSCASTQKQTDAGKIPQNTGEQQMQSQNTETSAADTEKAQNDDKGAPIYRYSENDRTKPFKKVGAGTGATTAEIADNAKNISTKKNKVSKPDAASEKTPADKDKSKTPGAATTPNKDGTAIGKADSAANKNEKKSMNAAHVEVPEMPFENAPSDENVYTPDYFSEFPNSDGAANETVMPSRSVTMNQKQRLKVRYPGEKWVFLGEQTSQKGLNYEQRKFQNGDTEFTFNAQKPGNYILNFSRYDAYSNSFIKDALEVSVGTSLAHAPATVQAPEYTLPAPLNDNAQKLSPTVKNSQQTAKQQLTPNNNGDLIIPVEEAQPVLAQTDLLEQAKQAIARGDAKSAIRDLKQFLKTSVERLDEAYFYLGQAYEINGSEKNIKEAYRAYKTVTDSFADSNFWISSDERIRYIKRFFIDIE